MNTTNHTPGPWEIIKKQGSISFKIMEGNHSIAKRREEFSNVVYETLAENISEENAPLISAAPDLLHALNLLLDKLNAHGIKNKHLFDAIEKAEGAISKAKGYK
jgi:hypothetical protein